MRLLHLIPAALLATSLVAHADTLQYTFAPLYSSPTNTFSFQLPSNPTPQDLVVNTAQQAFYVKNVTAIANGVPNTFYAVFNFTQNGAGFVLSGTPSNGPTFSEANVNGTPLYSGSPFSPTFLTGTFVLQETGAPYGGAYGILTVKDISVAATPEPSSFVLLSTGLLGAATLLRRRNSAGNLS